MTDGRTDGQTDGQTDGRTDGRTDGGDCNIPYAFLKKRGDKNRMSQCTSFENSSLKMPYAGIFVKQTFCS